MTPVAARHRVACISRLPATTMDDIQLHSGFLCLDLYDENKNADLLASMPIVQIISIKPITAEDDPSEQIRYRLIGSAGEHFDQAMLFTGLNYLIDQGDIIKNSVVALLDMEVAERSGHQ